MSLGGRITLVDKLINCLQMSLATGAKRVLMPMATAAAIPTVPGKHLGKIQVCF